MSSNVNISIKCYTTYKPLWNWTLYTSHSYFRIVIRIIRNYLCSVLNFFMVKVRLFCCSAVQSVIVTLVCITIYVRYDEVNIRAYASPL